MGAYFLKKQARSPILEGFGRNIYALLSFSGQQYIEIRNERRVELAFEGLRWADIRRWKIGEEVMVDAKGLDNTKLKAGMYPGDGKGETKDWKYVTITVDQRQFNPKRDYLWPIPQYEMDANENMIQNPGY